MPTHNPEAPMKRRDFLLACAGGALLGPALRAARQDLPDDITVTRVVGFDIETRRSKIAGKNSRLDVHGDRATDRMLRIYTNTGLEGVGNCRVDREAGQKLLGTNPFALYESE